MHRLVVVGGGVAVVHQGQVDGDRLVNRCSSRFQSNHHRGHLRRNKIIGSGAKKSTPSDSAGMWVTP